MAQLLHLRALGVKNMWLSPEFPIPHGVIHASLLLVAVVAAKDIDDVGAVGHGSVPFVYVHDAAIEATSATKTWGVSSTMALKAR